MMNEIEKLHLKVAKCTKCNSIIHHKKFPLIAHGNIRSKNMIISEAPGGQSLKKAMYWTGKSGTLLRDCVSEVGKEIEKDFYVTDMVKCWPNYNGRNRKPDRVEIKNCHQFIKKEIEIIQPKNILLFGQLASGLILKKSFRMEDYHGKNIEFEDGITVYFFYHPSYILRQNSESLKSEYIHLLTNTLNKMFHNGPATT